MQNLFAPAIIKVKIIAGLRKGLDIYTANEYKSCCLRQDKKIPKSCGI